MASMEFVWQYGVMTTFPEAKAFLAPCWSQVLALPIGLPWIVIRLGGGNGNV